MKVMPTYSVDFGLSSIPCILYFYFPTVFIGLGFLIVGNGHMALFGLRGNSFITACCRQHSHGVMVYGIIVLASSI